MVIKVGKWNSIIENLTRQSIGQQKEILSCPHLKLDDLERNLGISIYFSLLT